MTKTIQINQILQEVLNPMPDCEAAVYLDLQSNQVLGTYTYPSIRTDYEPTVLNMVIDYVMGIYASPAAKKLTEHFQRTKNLMPYETYIHKTLIKCAGHSYVCLRSALNLQHLFIFIFSHHIQKGMMLKEANVFAQCIDEKLNNCNWQKENNIEIVNVISNANMIDEIVILDNPIPSPPIKADSERMLQHHRANENQPKDNDILSALDRWLGKS